MDCLLLFRFLLRNFYTVFYNGCTGMYTGFLFVTFLSTLSNIYLLNIYLNGYEVTFQGGFDLNFPMISAIEHFHVFLANYVSWEKWSIRVFLLIFNWVVLLFWELSFPCMFCILENSITYMVYKNIFSHFFCWAKTFSYSSTFFFLCFCSLCFGYDR